MQIKHLDHLNLTVKDFEATRLWYERVFGFSLVEKGMMEGKPWGILKAGEALLCIYENPTRAFLDGDELEHHGLHGVNHFSLRIQDRESWEKTIKEEKIPIQSGGAYEYPHSTSWYLNDPTGYEIEVVLWHEDKVLFG